MGNEQRIGTTDTVVLSLRNGSTDVAAENPTAGYIHAATSQNTRTAYQSDIRHFIRWGGRLPTCAETAAILCEHKKPEFSHSHGGNADSNSAGSAILINML